MSFNPARGAFQGQMPAGTQVALYKTHQEASAAVDKLGEEDFPLAAVTIAGSDLHVVEQVMGRLTPARVALTGAGQGLTWGLLMGFFSLLAWPTAGVYIAMIAVAMGVLIGVLLNVVMWAASRNKRTFYSRSSMVASRYAVLVTEQVDRAFKILSGSPGNISEGPKRPSRLVATPVVSHGSAAESSREQRYQSRLGEPPKYGVRLGDPQDPSNEREVALEETELETEQVEDSTEETGR